MDLMNMLAASWLYYGGLGSGLIALIIFYVIYRRKQAD